MKTPKALLIICTLSILALSLGTARAADSDLRQALQAAIDDVRTQLAAAGLPRDRAISVLPIRGDQDRYVEGLLKIAVTAAGLNYVEGGSDPLWNEILSQVEWDERKEDMLDPATVTRFGKLQSTQTLLYGNLRAARNEGTRVYVELELHLTALDTAQHVWGTLVSRRFYLPGKVEGIVALDRDAREALNQTIAKGLESLKRSQKLSSVGTVAIVPLAGDIDMYITGRVQDMVSQTHMNPRNLDVLTLGEARQLLRDKPGQADAVLFGALRDLSREQTRAELLRDTWEVSAEIQLTLQSATTGDVLWSDTLHHLTEVVKTKSGEEKLVEISRNNPRMWFYIGGGLIGLILIARFIKASTRVR